MFILDCVFSLTRGNEKSLISCCMRLLLRQFRFLNAVFSEASAPARPVIETPPTSHTGRIDLQDLSTFSRCQWWQLSFFLEDGGLACIPCSLIVLSLLWPVGLLFPPQFHSSSCPLHVGYDYTTWGFLHHWSLGSEPWSAVTVASLCLCFVSGYHLTLICPSLHDCLLCLPSWLQELIPISFACTFWTCIGFSSLNNRVWNCCDIVKVYTHVTVQSFQLFHSPSG